MNNPINGFKLLTANGEHDGSIYEYSSQIWYFRDRQTYLIIKIAFLFDLFTFSSYSATAVLFATISFSGVWALFVTFYGIAKEMHFWLAFAVLFVPSVFFWGSGILKDTLTLGCLGWVSFAFYRLILLKESGNITLWILLIVNVLLIYSVKTYIIISFIPALIVWFFAGQFNKIRNTALKVLVTPLVIAVCFFLGYLAIELVSLGESKYSLNNLAKTAQITAYDIRYGWGARFGDGAGYTLGELDGTFTSMIRLVPAAINVSLFRPYLWEVRNPLMLLSALEAFASLLATIWVVYRISLASVFRYLSRPEILFCLVFAIVFAIAVGISTYNFGSLARYKIPLMPFYASALVFFYYEGSVKRFRKLDLLASKE